MTAPESRDSASTDSPEQSMLTLVREAPADVSPLEASAAENSRPVVPARRKIWPA
jgi:hypothetical protein